MFEELQSLNEAQKRNILIVATIIIMVVVVGAWSVYFKSIVMAPSAQEAEQATSTPVAPTTAVAPAVTATNPVASPASGPSLWQNIENGFGSIGNIVTQPSQYNIQPNQ